MSSIIINPYQVSAAGGPPDTFPSQGNIELRCAGKFITGHSDLDTLPQWDDSSGNARHLTQVTSAARPVYHASGGANNLPYVLFDATATGGGSFFNVPNLLTGFTQGEIFMVVKSAADPPASTLGGPEFWGTSTDNELYPYNGDSHIYSCWGSNVRKDAGNPTPSLASWHLLNIESSSGNWKLRINRAAHSFSTGTNTVAFTSSARIGHDKMGLGWNGSIGEFVFCSVIRSAPERSDLESYFSAEHAITLT